MYRHDCVSRTLCKYRFNLYRENELIENYLKKHLNAYYDDIKNSLEDDNSCLGEDIIALIKKELPTLKKICEEIPQILKAYNLGDSIQAQNNAMELFDFMNDFLIIGLMQKQEVFYRIREGDFRIENEDSKKKKKKLFHIPQSLRSKVGSYRYSIAGVPCLYLSGDRELAWYECGMPKKFSYCQMKIDNVEDEELKLLNFSFEPVDYLSNYYCSLINSRRRNDIKKVNMLEKHIVKYIISYPLVISCSMKVKDRSAKFIEEYIMPQLLMQWIKSNDKIDGIVYKSSLYSNLIDGLGAKNIVFPVTKYRKDGLDEKLTEKLLISDIGYIDVSVVFEKYMCYLKELQNFIYDLKYKSIRSNFPYLDFEMIDLCNQVIKTYEIIIDNDYKNIELLFNIISGLYDHFELFYKYRDSIIQEQIDSRKQYFERIDDIEKVKAEELEIFEKLNHLMKKILKKHMIYDFEFEIMDNYEKI